MMISAHIEEFDALLNITYDVTGEGMYCQPVSAPSALPIGKGRGNRRHPAVV